MTAAGDLEDAAALLRVLGHGVRLRLLASLAPGERSVSDIEASTGIGQPMLSQQLGFLRKAELVMTRREAKQIFYRLHHERLSGVGAILDGLAGSRDPQPGTRPSAPVPRGSSVAMFARLD